MSDRYQQLVNTPIGKLVTKQVGLPAPPILDRYRPGQPVISGSVLFGAHVGAAGAIPRLVPQIAATLKEIGATTATPVQSESPTLRTAVAEAGLEATIFNPDAPAPGQKFKALVFDATALKTSEDLIQVYEFFHGASRRGQLQRSDRAARHPARDDRGLRGGRRPALARGARALARQGGALRRDRAAALRRPRRRGPARLHAALSALAAFGLRRRPGDPRRRAGLPPPASTTGPHR